MEFCMALRMTFLAAVFLALPAQADERLTATYAGHDMYDLSTGRRAFTRDCEAPTSEAFFDDLRKTLTFIEDEEECEVLGVK
jgi:hypothetical protein